MMRTLRPDFLVRVALLLLASACGTDLTEERTITDDFCHGEADGVRCDDGNDCTEDDVCGNGVCLGRAVPDNVVCDDALLCTTLDYCEAGVCKGRAVDCAGTRAGVCEAPACDPKSGECVAVAVAVGSCDDGDPCTVADACTAAGCVGAPQTCSDTVVGECEVAICDPETGGCAVVKGPDGARCGDASNLCVVPACQGGACVLSPKCPTTAAGCKIGVCDPASGSCTYAPKSDEAPCEDGNACVRGEACLAGECVGGAVEPDGTLCQDGNPCHTVGLCTGGACQAPDKDCSGLTTQCTVGVCDADTGDCAAENRPAGASCDDGQLCTTGEQCDAGLCVAKNSACSCTGKADGTSCDDADPCTAGDACKAGLCLGAPKDCSAKDGACTLGDCVAGVCEAVPAVDGTLCDDGDACSTDDACLGGGCHGAPVVCEAAPCMRAECDSATGQCTTLVAPFGAACNDGDPCTQGDRCNAGSCVPGLELCAACSGKAGADACDDASACTTGDVCTAEGDALFCRGIEKACPVSTPCRVATCNALSGTCGVALAPEGDACDDADGCTVADTCSANGACAGTAVELCGANIAACLPGTPPALPWTVLAWLEAAGPTEVPLTLTVGQSLTVTTAPHCGAPVDTLLELVDPSGKVIAQADDSDGPFAVLEDVFISDDGQHTLRVYGAFIEARTSLLLSVAAVAPKACTSDAQCACADKQCVSAGAGKVCTMKHAEAGAAAGPLPVELGAVVRGRLVSGAGTFAVAVTLKKGEPLTALTRSLCGSVVDTNVTVRGPDGVVIAQADAGAVAPFAAVEAALPLLAGVHTIEVDSTSAGTGDFVLEVRSGLCTKTAECVCSERACSGQPGLPGICAPKLDVSEPVDQTLPALAIGNRIHAVLATSEDLDEYTVQLSPGTYNVRVRGFCGATTTATALVLPPTGPVVLATGAPDVVGVEIAAGGMYRVRVGGGVGDYTLLVEVAP